MILISICSPAAPAGRAGQVAGFVVAAVLVVHDEFLVDAVAEDVLAFHRRRLPVPWVASIARMAPACLSLSDAVAE